MLTGLIAPSSGRATAFGAFDTARRPPLYLRRIGMVMGQRNQLNPDLPATDSFRLAQAIYGLDEDRCQSRLDTCLDLFSIRDKASTPVRKLSLGERMKMELILAILHEPELLFLDEPTIGLDFNAARQIRGFLAEANRRLGITVVLTSHYTKDIEELCRRVILINHGRIVYDGPLAGMDERLQGERTLTLTLADREALSRATADATRLAGSEPVKLRPAVETTDAATLTLTLDVAARRTPTVLAKMLGALPEASVLDVKVGERALDEIFSELYQKPRSDA
jgi:ABC-2 type transport system ATP-binding protein